MTAGRYPYSSSPQCAKYGLFLHGYVHNALSKEFTEAVPILFSFYARDHPDIHVAFSIEYPCFFQIWPRP